MTMNHTHRLILTASISIAVLTLSGCASRGYDRVCDWCDDASQAQLRKDVAECNAIAEAKVPNVSFTRKTGRIITTHGSTTCSTNKRGETTCSTGSSYTYPEEASVDATNYQMRKEVFDKCADARAKNYRPKALPAKAASSPASTPAVAQSFKAPQEALQKPKKATDEGMLLANKAFDSEFGPANKVSDCHRVTATDQNGIGTYCLKPATAQKISNDGRDRYFILGLGERIGANGEPESAHAYAGLVVAMVVEATGGKLIVNAKSHDLTYGSWGAAPGNWTLTRLGADTWGWVNQWDSCSSAQCVGSLVVLTPVGNRIYDTATELPAGMSDEMFELKSVSVEVMFDNRDMNNKYYPIRLKVTETKNDKTPEVRYVTAVFSQSSNRYKLKEFP